MASKEAALAFINALKRDFPNHRAFSKLLFEFMEGFTDLPTMVSKVKSLLHGHRHHLLSFSNFLPETYKFAIHSAADKPAENFDSEIPANHRSEYSQAEKDAVEPTEKFDAEIPAYHRSSSYGRSEKDAVEPTDKFDAKIPANHRSASKRSRGEEKDAVELQSKKAIKKVRKEAIEFVNKVRKLSSNDAVYVSFLRIVTDFHAHKNIVKVDTEISDLFKSNPELYLKFTWFAADSWPPKNSGNRQSKPPDSDKTFTVKSTSKSDKISQECEDELFESDMLFHSLESTKNAAEELLLKTGENQNCNRGEDQKIEIEDFYSAMTLRCIKQMYGEYAEDMIELLRINPVAASWILLNRLSVKLDEAREWREEVKEHCAKIFINCYGEE